MAKNEIVKEGMYLHSTYWVYNSNQQPKVVVSKSDFRFVCNIRETLSQKLLSRVITISPMQSIGFQTNSYDINIWNFESICCSAI